MVNAYFNNFTNTSEQNLFEDLIVEAIDIHAYPFYFLPRTLGNKSEIYGEDSLSTYDTALTLDCYIKSFDNYEGDGTFLSKFNLEIRDQLTLSAARRTFAQQVTSALPDLIRPREGDLIYAPMLKRMFIIKFVNNNALFYQLGKLYTWDIVTEMWEYSNERFATGIAEIDELEDTYSVANVYANTAYEQAMDDVFATNQEFNEFNNEENLIDWNSLDPFSSRS